MSPHRGQQREMFYHIYCFLEFQNWILAKEYQCAPWEIVGFADAPVALQQEILDYC